MNFKLEGDINVNSILEKRSNEEKAKELAHQILEKKIYLTGISSEINLYNERMLPRKMSINELIERMNFITYKNDSITDVSKIFENAFASLEADTNELTIVDAYIFSKGTNADFLCDVLLKNVGSKKVRFITSRKALKPEIESQVTERLKLFGFQVEVIRKDIYHDRVWLTNKGGFMIGASFNGISRNQYTIILKLESEDLAKVIEEHKKY